MAFVGPARVSSMAAWLEVRDGLANVRRLELEGNVVGLVHELESTTERGGRGQVRAQAALALGRLGRPQAVPYLLPLTDDRSSHVRWAATYALVQLQAPEAEDAFLRGLEDDASLVRMSSARGLGGLKANRAAPVLRRRLRSDEDAWVRVNSAEALAAIGDHSFADAIDGELDRLDHLPWWRRKRGLRKHWLALREVAQTRDGGSNEASGTDKAD